MKISKILFYLPDYVLTTEMLSKEFPEWPVEKIIKKMGIKNRHICHEDEYVSDMAVSVAEKLFSSGVDRESIDYLIVCTQSPDYLGPATACLVQSRLKLKKSIGAIDINLGCSGYVYALSLAYGLIASKQVKTVLIITADTYSKFLDPQDKSLRILFGDGATVTLLVGEDTKKETPVFLFGTDGNGAENLIIKNSGMKHVFKNRPFLPRLYMNGPEIMSFVLKNVSILCEQLIEKSKSINCSIKYFIFHQASLPILEALKEKLSISADQFIIDLSDTGNTGTSTIPIALSNLIGSEKLKENDTVLLLSFGMGYSWAGCIFNM